MRKSPNGKLKDILDAGGWRSSAFLLYLSREETERDAVSSLIIDLSEDEDPLEHRTMSSQDLQEGDREAQRSRKWSTTEVKIQITTKAGWD